MQESYRAWVSEVCTPEHRVHSRRITPLYKGLGRPYFENCIQLLSLYYKKDLKMKEYRWRRQVDYCRDYLSDSYRGRIIFKGSWILKRVLNDTKYLVQCVLTFFSLEQCKALLQQTYGKETISLHIIHRGWKLTMVWQILAAFQKSMEVFLQGLQQQIIRYLLCG